MVTLKRQFALVRLEVIVCSYEDRISVGWQILGPAVRLGSEVSVTLAMALHELTSNAAKYGALSTPEGRINVTWWATASELLSIEWTEMGGPPVMEPARRGFGSDLIERGLARQLGGTAVLEFNKAGIRCVITAPLPKTVESIA